MAQESSKGHCRRSTLLILLNMFIAIVRCFSFLRFSESKHFIKLLIFLCRRPIYLRFKPTHYICIISFLFSSILDIPYRFFPVNSLILFQLSHTIQKIPPGFLSGTHPWPPSIQSFIIASIVPSCRPLRVCRRA